MPFLPSRGTILDGGRESSMGPDVSKRQQHYCSPVIDYTIVNMFFLLLFLLLFKPADSSCGYLYKTLIQLIVFYSSNTRNINHDF